MGSILRRLNLLMKVWANAVFSPAEDPRQIYASAHQHQQQLLGKVRQAQANIAASKEKLEAKTSNARDRLPQLEQQARQALLDGKEDMARFALQLRHAAGEELQNLEQQGVELQKEEQALALVEQRLTTQIEAFFARQEVLAARYTSAEAQVRINEALGGVSEEMAGLGLALEKAELEAEHMESRATAIDQLVELGVLDVPGSQMPSAIMERIGEETSSAAVEESLADLKQQLGLDGA